MPTIVNETMNSAQRPHQSPRSHAGRHRRHRPADGVIGGADAGGRATTFAEPRAVRPNSGLSSRATVNVGPALVVGDGPHGLRRIIAIEGGTFTGPRLSGKVLPGGADWQVIRPDGVAEIEARYTLETDDGALIYVRNPGIRTAPKAVMDRLARGERCDPSEYYFRTCPVFETGGSAVPVAAQPGVGVRRGAPSR